MNIVVGYDGSEGGKRALERAAAIGDGEDRISWWRPRSRKHAPGSPKALISTRPSWSSGDAISTRRGPS